MLRLPRRENNKNNTSDEGLYISQKGARYTTQHRMVFQNAPHSEIILVY